MKRRQGDRKAVQSLQATATSAALVVVLGCSAATDAPGTDSTRQNSAGYMTPKCGSVPDICDGWGNPNGPGPEPECQGDNCLPVSGEEDAEPEPASDPGAGGVPGDPGDPGTGGGGWGGESFGGSAGWGGESFGGSAGWGGDGWGGDGWGDDGWGGESGGSGGDYGE